MKNNEFRPVKDDAFDLLKLVENGTIVSQGELAAKIKAKRAACYYDLGSLALDLTAESKNKSKYSN